MESTFQGSGTPQMKGCACIFLSGHTEPVIGSLCDTVRVLKIRYISYKEDNTCFTVWEQEQEKTSRHADLLASCLDNESIAVLHRVLLVETNGFTPRARYVFSKILFLVKRMDIL